MLLPIAEVATRWQDTWAHPSLHDAINTALSLDHLAAEGFVELITGIFGYAIGRKLLRRHDKKHHHGIEVDDESVS